MPGKPKVFRPGGAKTRQEIAKQHDQHRGSARKRGYDTRWDRVAGHFKRTHPLCLGCEAVGRVTAAFLVDHVIPHRGDQVLFWDPENWQAACEWHGNAIKQQLERLFDQGKATKADLWLNSNIAKALTLKSIAGGGI